jgi:hypothetical protein
MKKQTDEGGSKGRRSRHLDRSRMEFEPLANRRNRVSIPDSAVDPDAAPTPLSDAETAALDSVVRAIRAARGAGSPVVAAFGAHTIKNGLGLVLNRLLESGWITHLATNGAGIIHDWEFAYQGESSEDVRTNVATGRFGMWEETGLYLNLAIAIGAYAGLGYGASIGALIEDGGLRVPSADELQRIACAEGSIPVDRRAAALDLLAVLGESRLGRDRSRRLREAVDASGRLAIPHPFARYSVQAAAYRAGVPCTAHPMFGHDIIYTHPANHGAAIGRAAERDFLSFAEAISRLEDGVYLSIGSAVMSPMIFEKSLSMGRNLARQRGEGIEGHTICVVDLAPSNWDWERDGEPPADDPAYYLRFMKTFHRMGGVLHYLSVDNRNFLLHLRQSL